VAGLWRCRPAVGNLIVPQYRVVIIGAGRMGQGLGLALHRHGYGVALLARTRHPVIAPLVVHQGVRLDALREAELVLLAVPDDAVRPLATELASEDGVGEQHVVLHLSGLLDRSALAPLGKTGAGLGSFHPLQTIADPASAPDRFAGAYAGIEGDARALAAGERMATALRMMTVRIAAEAKPVYHAGAVAAANYTVALAGLAERLAQSAGIPAQAAAKMFLPLLRGAVANLELGPAAALTGPVRRGDVRTIRAHLAALGPDDRELYRWLGLAALRLAREAGLDAGAADEVEKVLRDVSP
jgi:predicted short-subunit dehydrogenase-like oxidoreductase (DUF2520 family)